MWIGGEVVAEKRNLKYIVSLKEHKAKDAKQKRISLCALRNTLRLCVKKTNAQTHLQNPPFFRAQRLLR
jgi:hypothetical protein